MIKRILLSFMLLVSVSAKADYPANTSGSPYYSACTSCGYFPSKELACLSAEPKTSPPNRKLIVSGNYCAYQSTPSIQPFALTTRTSNCPNGGTYNSSTQMCIGADPPQPPPGSCPKDTKGKGSWQAGKSDGSPYTSPFATGGCVNSCKVTMDDVESCHSYSDGYDYCIYSWTSQGTTCAAGDGSQAPGTPPADANPPRKDVPPYSPPPGQKCPSGTVSGGMTDSGVPICIGTGSAPKNAPPPAPKVEKENTEPQPDGGTKTTKTETTSNSDGSTTTKTTTTTVAADGTRTVNVSQNVTNSTKGTPGKDDSKREDDKYDLCKSNPHLTICRNSTVSGSCGQISCMGDAIQCATLRAAAAMQCAQAEDKAALQARPEVAAGNAILAGNDPMKGDIENAIKGTEVDMSAPNLDDTGFVGSRACLSPRTFQAFGKAITVEFGALCDNIEPLRYVVLACAWILAYLIVSRSVLGS